MDTKTSPLVVGRGVDTLVLNVYFRGGQHKPCKREIPHELKEQLEAWKQAAIVEEEPVPVPLTFEGVNLHMYPNGAGKGQWRWLLRCESFNLLVSMGRLNCVAQVRFSSEFLWSCRGVDDAIVRVEEFLVHSFLQECVYLQVSEVHLCADIAGWDVESIDQRRDFVSRSRKRGTYEVTDLDIQDFSYGLTRSGFLFSRGGPISCVIYDKTREIRQQSQKWWFHDLWQANGWDMEEQQESDKTQVIRKRKYQGNLERAVASTVGYLSSMAAWLGRDGEAGEEADLLYMIAWLRERTPVYLGKRARKFAKEVERKRIRFERQRAYEQDWFYGSSAASGLLGLMERKPGAMGGRW